MTLRDRLHELPAGTELLRELRYLTGDPFADLTDDELDRARQWLRAASYSALEGARKIERELDRRRTAPAPQSPTIESDTP